MAVAPGPRGAAHPTTRRRGGHLVGAYGLLVAAFALVTTACGSTPSPGARAAKVTAPSGLISAGACRPSSRVDAPPPPGSVEGSIRVLAASSLTEAFAELGDAFTARYPDAKAELSFGASSELVARIHEGAPADVLVTADATTMNLAADPGDGSGPDVDAPVTLTCNQMTLITAHGNPLGITWPGGLNRDGVRFVVCAAEVPCGRAAREVLGRAGVKAEPVGSEANVKAVVAKVASGEVDAGIVYVTDALAAADSTGQVAIPAPQNVTTSYEIAAVRRSDDPATAKAFVAFATSAEGRGILRDHGFGRP